MKLDKARQWDFGFYGFSGGITFFPYQVALGFSYNYLKCFEGRLFRLYFLWFKLWINYKPKEIGEIKLSSHHPAEYCTAYWFTQNNIEINSNRVAWIIYDENP